MVWYNLDHQIIEKVDKPYYYDLEQNKLVKRKSKSGKSYFKKPRVCGTVEQINNFISINNKYIDQDKILKFDLNGLETEVQVYNVVDGDTFDCYVEVPREYLSELRIYGNKIGVQMICCRNLIMNVRIRMYNYNAAELRTKEGKQKHLELESQILNQTIRLRFHGKGKYGRYLAEII